MPKAEQYLVTGGTGFIGRFVVRQLLQRKVPVRLLCRTPAKTRRLFGDSSDIVAGDLCDADACQRACRGMHTVIHVGGLYHFGRRHNRSLMTVNVTGTDKILQAAWTNRMTRFVHISTASVLEARTGLVTERDFPSRVPAHQGYRYSKWRGECRALEWAARGLPVVIVNPPVPLGAEDETPTPSGQIVADFLQGRFPFSSRTGLNIVHVADLADGIIAATERGRPGERYLLGHHNLSLHELLQLLALCSGQRPPWFCLPWGLVALAGQLGELAGSDRLCRETASHARRRAGYSSQKAADEFGWRPNRPLEQTAREAITWFRQRLHRPAPYATELSLERNVAG